jgi:transcriptional regulator with GAF, ATPase, and Fis domain
VVLASLEFRSGNHDEALLALFEAERLAEGEGDPRYRRLIAAMRSRVESQMARVSTRVIDQFALLREVHSTTPTRENLESGLSSTLRIIMEKGRARAGFVAIRSRGGRGLALGAVEGMGKATARRLLERIRANGWHSGEGELLRLTDSRRSPELAEILEEAGGDNSTYLVQALGSNEDRLGFIFLWMTNAPSQEFLDFLGAYGSLIAISLYEVIQRERQDRKTPTQREGFQSIITENERMIQLLALAEKVAHSDATVLLQGETGTGKGLIAYAIHMLSHRRDRAFVHVNCAALPETLLESELFGHVRGAFTGAVADKVGLLKQADGGTIFLDEIGKTSLAMQGKLLQFLDTGKVRPVGSNELVPVDVRVICASKADLMDLCHQGRFLEDFFYRINDFPLTVPPLRERRDDIPLLVKYYLEKSCSRLRKVIPGVKPDAMERLKSYRWPGNVRELEKVVQRAVILAEEGQEIGLEHLPPEILRDSAEVPQSGGTLRERLEQLERRLIAEALARAGGNRSRAARELGISYPTLLSKIKRYRLGA